MLTSSFRFKDLSAVCVSPSGEYVCADGVVFVFSPEGKKLREFGVPGFGSKGRLGGLACDENGFLLATHSVKKQSFIQVRKQRHSTGRLSLTTPPASIQVLRYESGELYSSIDSHGCRMKRPTGLAVFGGAGERHLVLVDIGFDCVRKYRYF